uniref:Protein phosphatase 1 regulatory subunit 14 n=1 Tax=Bos mutus grunniens TaxID=30521 RepID=A0A8B9YH86_BOSMU
MLQLPRAPRCRPRRGATRSRAHELTSGLEPAGGSGTGGPDARTWPRQPLWRTAALAPELGVAAQGPASTFRAPGAAGEARRLGQQGPSEAPREGHGQVLPQELRKRLILEEWVLEQLTHLYDCQEEEIPELEIDEEWVLEQLTHLYDCQEEEIPELEIDGDELPVTESDNTRAARVKELLVDCYKPTEAFISDLLDKIRGMQKLSTPQKK